MLIFEYFFTEPILYFNLRLKWGILVSFKFVTFCTSLTKLPVILYSLKKVQSSCRIVEFNKFLKKIVNYNFV